MYTKENAIEDFKGEINKFSRHLSDYNSKYLNSGDKAFVDLKVWSMSAFWVVERALVVSLMDKGVEMSDRGIPTIGDGRFLPPVSYAINNMSDAYTPQCIELLKKMRMTRNSVAHACEVDRETLAVFFSFFKSVINWFLIETDELYKEYESEGILSTFYDIDRNISMMLANENQNILIENAVSMNEKLDMLLKGQKDIKGQLDDIQEKVEQINDRISGYQSLVEKQIEMAESSDEIERLIQVFSEECTENIVNTIDERMNQKAYENALTNLKASFGENAWDKLDDSSKSFLISSKMMFNQFTSMEDVVDYSGVCLLITKGLEVELNKRFFTGYLSHLKLKYIGPANYSKFPYSMLDRNGEPLKAKKFTLGSVAYITGIYTPKGASDEEIKHNLDEFEEYARAELFSNDPDIDVIRTLQTYAVKIDDIRVRFRNPSAHKNEVKKINAIDCFDMVVDVEKLLRVMLESFDK